MSLSEVIRSALDQITQVAKTETVVGEPIEAGGVILIPVSKISIGFAGGGGGQEGKNGTGAGTGGGVNIIPVAFIAVANGKVQVHPVSKLEPDLGQILSLAPDVVRKVAEWAKKGQKKSGRSGKGDHGETDGTSTNED